MIERWSFGGPRRVWRAYRWHRIARSHAPGAGYELSIRISCQPVIWEARYRRYSADGTVERPREVFGDEIEFSNKTGLKNSPKWQQFIQRINNIRVAVFFRDLCRLYREEEVIQRVFKGQSTAKGQLCYLEDKWGGIRLDQLIQKKYEIRSWLQGDLPLRTNPEAQVSRQTLKHLRTLLVQMPTYAVDKHYLPYNPFTGTALTVKRGSAARGPQRVFHHSGTVPLHDE